MREFPIKKFWYGKGAAYRTIEELIEKNPKWFIWAVETFQDVTEEQARHFYEVYSMELPPYVITPQSVMNEINGGSPYEYKKGDSEEIYKDLCRKYTDKTGQKWNDWLKADYGEQQVNVR